MPMPLRWLLSLIFIVQMYVMMAVLAIAFAISSRPLPSLKASRVSPTTAWGIRRGT